MLLQLNADEEGMVTMIYLHFDEEEKEILGGASHGDFFYYRGFASPQVPRTCPLQAWLS